MATIIYVEGWEHQSLSTNDFNAADGEGILDFQAGAVSTIVTTNPRSGLACLRVAAAGASAGIEKNVPGANPAVSTVGLGIRFEGSLPGANVHVWHFNLAAGTAPRLLFNSATSKFNIAFSTATPNTDIGPVLVADQWYWVDLRADASTGTHTLDGAVDAGTSAQVTLVQAASTFTIWKFGTSSAQTFTALYDDFVASNTAGDFPLGKKKVLPLYPNGDGSHNTGGAGNFDKVGGADITDATTDAWLEIDDWITGASDNGTTGILNLLNAPGTLYTEHTFDDTAEATIDAVMGTMASAVSSATAHTATYRIVDSGGSTIKDLFAGDVSISIATHYRHVLVSQNPTTATVNGYKFRFGFSTDAAPDPQVTTVMLSIAVPEAAGVTITVDTPGAITWAGQSVATNTLITVSPGAVTWAGATDITLSVATLITVDTPGAVTWAGQSTALTTTIGVTAGAITWAGATDITLSVATLITVDVPGAITWTGQGIALVTTITPTAGAIQWAGATDIAVGVITTITVDTPGQITWAGQAVPLGFVLTVTPGTVTWAGATIGLVHTITPAVGAITWAGQSVTFGLTVGVAPGAITWAGSTVTLSGGEPPGTPVRDPQAKLTGDEGKAVLTGDEGKAVLV